MEHDIFTFVLMLTHEDLTSERFFSVRRKKQGIYRANTIVVHITDSCIHHKNHYRCRIPPPFISSS